MGEGAPAAVALPDQDSLTLIKLVGVPILKRVVPVAALAALIAVLGRRIRALFKRSKV